MKPELKLKPKPVNNLSPAPEVKEEVKKEVKTDSIVEEYLNSINLSFNEDKETLKLIYDSYGLVEQLKNKEIREIDCLKGFLENFSQILKLTDKIGKNDKKYKKFKQLIAKEQEKIKKLIEVDGTDEYSVKELTYLLDETQKVYNVLISKKVKLLEGEERKLLQNVEVKKFDIPEVKKAYKELYAAIKTDKSDVITSARTKVIKELEKNSKTIDAKYAEVRCLLEINNLLSNGASLDEIGAYLDKEENKEYKKIFADKLGDPKDFIQAFLIEYVSKDVETISNYYGALKSELKEQERLLDERYGKEFLDKKATLITPITVLPNATGLSVQKLANTISEVKAAKTNRRKNYEIKEAIKDALKVGFTPFLYFGKFAVNNWYPLYQVLNGINAANKVKEEVTQEQQTVSNKPNAKPQVSQEKPSQTVATAEEKPSQTVTTAEEEPINEEVVESAEENLTAEVDTEPSNSVDKDTVAQNVQELGRTIGKGAIERAETYKRAIEESARLRKSLVETVNNGSSLAHDVDVNGDSQTATAEEVTNTSTSVSSEVETDPATNSDAGEFIPLNTAEEEEATSVATSVSPEAHTDTATDTSPQADIETDSGVGEVIPLNIAEVEEATSVATSVSPETHTDTATDTSPQTDTATNTQTSTQTSAKPQAKPEPQPSPSTNPEPDVDVSPDPSYTYNETPERNPLGWELVHGSGGTDVPLLLPSWMIDLIPGMRETVENARAARYGDPYPEFGLSDDSASNIDLSSQSSVHEVNGHLHGGSSRKF